MVRHERRRVERVRVRLRVPRRNRARQGQLQDLPPQLRQPRVVAQRDRQVDVADVDQPKRTLQLPQKLERRQLLGLEREAQRRTLVERTAAVAPAALAE